MLEKLFREWRSAADLMDSSVESTVAMVTHAEAMIRATIGELVDGTPTTMDVAAKDDELNAMQVAIRRGIVGHLHVHPGRDVLPAITLLTVVTFLERLGDYAKNLRELSQALDRPFAEVPHADRLRALTGEVLGMFDLTRRALATEEVQEARAVLAKNRAISAEARRLIESFLREPQGDSRPAVLAVLFARYLKRISGHLMNAASSVINAFDQIGFYPEKDRIADDE